MRWPSKWLTRRRVFRGVLYGIATLAVLIALFYFEENWRGLRAWNHFKAQAETKGERFDQSALTSPSCPDDQNFALAPTFSNHNASYFNFINNRESPTQTIRTNMVDRLAMGLTREDEGGFGYLDSHPPLGLTNLSAWRNSKFADLIWWQHHFRDTPKVKKTIQPWRGGAGRKPNWQNSVIYATNEFPLAPHTQRPAEDVLLALSRYNSTIEELRVDTTRSNCWFPIRFDAENPFKFVRNGGGCLLPCSEILDLRSVAELNLGNTAQALQDVLMALRLAETATNELFMWSLWPSRVINMSIQPIWEGLANHRWSDSQLETLEDELAKFDFLALFDRQIREDRTLSLDEIEYLRKIHNKGIAEPAPEEEKNFGAWMIESFYHAFPQGWYYENELFAAQYYQVQLSQFDLTARTLFSKPETNDSAYPLIARASLLSPYGILASFAVRSSTSIQYAFTQVTIELARVACAAGRYRIANGKYPPSLDVLSPQFISPLPHDLINGEPLHYKADGDQIMIYSLGWDGVDDQGAMLWNSAGDLRLDRGDWVFRIK
jgi:hypothetical protein